MANCEVCGSDVSHSVRECVTCGAFVGYPNVRAAESKPEVEALGERYLSAILESRTSNSESNVYAFEETVKNSVAVLSTSIEVLRQFASEKNFLYSTYGLSVKGELRTSAEAENDSLRRMVDAYLFGGYAEEIRYAALSLDGKGLSNYGSCFLTLKDIAIRQRTSLLEENSFSFFNKHAHSSGFRVPPGSRCVWANREKLAVVKCSSEISSTTTHSDFVGILLREGQTRAEDLFIEVHVFGPINNAAIEAVCFHTPSIRGHQKAVMETIRELLEKQGKKCVEDA